MKYLIFNSTLLLFLVVLFSCKQSINQGDENEIEIIEPNTSTLKYADNYYEMRFESLKQIEAVDSFLDSNTCRSIYLVQNNGCVMCERDKLEKICQDINSSQYDVAIFFVQNSSLESIPFLETFCSKGITARISVLEANENGVNFLTNFKLNFCGKKLLNWKIID